MRAETPLLANHLCEWPSWLRRPLKSELLGPRNFRLRKLESDSAEPRWLVERYSNDLLTSVGRPPARSLRRETRADSSGNLGSSDVTSTSAISSRSSHSCSVRDSEWTVAGSITVLRTVSILFCSGGPDARVVCKRVKARPTFHFSAGPLPRQLPDELFVEWLERQITCAGRGDNDTSLDVEPAGKGSAGDSAPFSEISTGDAPTRGEFSSRRRSSATAFCKRWRCARRTLASESSIARMRNTCQIWVNIRWIIQRRLTVKSPQTRASL